MSRPTLRHTLYERLHGWCTLLATREDLDFFDMMGQPLPRARAIQTDPGAKTPLAAYPDDAKAFARQASGLRFSYRREDDDGDISGFLYLDLRGMHEDAYLIVDDEVVDVGSMYILDCDAEGTGLASWFVLGSEPYVVWDVETVARYPSLTDYLTAGARRGFSYAPCWQRPRSALREEEAPLSRISLSGTTPLPELRERLVARGASASLADDLVAWLGADVRLLLPRDGG